MTNQQAQKQAQKRWGKKAAVRNAGKFSGTERRQDAADHIAQLKSERDALLKEKAERLKALDWLTGLDKNITRLNVEIRNEVPKTHFYRFDVGRIGGAGGFQFFEVLGSGDTWEEAFTRADKRTA